MDEAAGPAHAGSRRRLIQSKERTVICDVKCVEECYEGKLLAPVICPDKSASICTGASLNWKNKKTQTV
jgi:hypothetical protein